MREDHLLAVQPRQFVVTISSNHELEVYLNLAYRMKLTGIDQLWVADITYIRLRAEFVYLAVILDGFSHKVLGWALANAHQLAGDSGIAAGHHKERRSTASISLSVAVRWEEQRSKNDVPRYFADCCR